MAVCQAGLQVSHGHVTFIQWLKKILMVLWKTVDTQNLMPGWQNCGKQGNSVSTCSTTLPYIVADDTHILTVHMNIMVPTTYCYYGENIIKMHELTIMRVYCLCTLSILGLATNFSWLFRVLRTTVDHLGSENIFWQPWRKDSQCNNKS